MAGTVIAGSVIQTADGVYFDYLDPDPAHFTLNAIAQGLANTCRFGGHCNRFYSVAEHSVHVAGIVEPVIAVYGLLHDAAEAFIGDVPSPLKALLPDFQVVEKRIETALLASFGLDPAGLRLIKEADLAMLEIEHRALFDRHDEWVCTQGVELPDVEIECWDPKRAKQNFLWAAQDLGLS